VTLKSTQKFGSLSEDILKIDKCFIENYASTYWFYHQCIRLEEVEGVKQKLPHFPIALLKYFRLNEFLDNIRIRGDLKNILTFLNSSQNV